MSKCVITNRRPTPVWLLIVPPDALYQCRLARTNRDLLMSECTSYAIKARRNDWLKVRIQGPTKRYFTNVVSINRTDDSEKHEKRLRLDIPEYARHRLLSKSVWVDVICLYLHNVKCYATFARDCIELAKLFCQQIKFVGTTRCYNTCIWQHQLCDKIGVDVP